MNRIAHAVAKMRAQIEGRIKSGITTEERVEETRKALDMDFVEFARFQELKSLAVASGTLTLEEGQYIYARLGETPATFNGQDAATKAVLTNVFKEMLERSLSHARV